MNHRYTQGLVSSSIKYFGDVCICRMYFISIYKQIIGFPPVIYLWKIQYPSILPRRQAWFPSMRYINYYIIIFLYIILLFLKMNALNEIITKQS